MKESDHNENVFALRANDNQIIHISEVQRKDTGRGPGYYCLGCKRRLQAVLSTIDNRKKFFRHDAEAVKGQPKCTYSDETYRHKLAKDILQTLKRIKVPNLYKYSTEDKIPRKYLIKESHFVEADKVLNEVFLYENELGEIEYSRDEELASDKFLIIKPDVLFLDSNDKPILIIEMVATHKPDTKKLVKLKRLGIAAVQVRIPKDSPEAIEQTFRHTNNTFWTYNYEEDNTEPISISDSYPEGISELDKLQRRFFEENFVCRRSQIENLIRQINRLLESEQYREIVKRFRSEIRRASENADRVGKRLDERRRELRQRGIERHSERREKLTEDEGVFQQYQAQLENRYRTKDRELETARNSFEYKIIEHELQQEELNSKGNSIGRTIEEEERVIARIRGQIKELPGIERGRRADIERRIAETRNQSVEFEEASRELQGNINRSGELLDSKEKTLEREIDSEIRRVEAEISRVQREIQGFESEERTLEGTIRSRYPQNREEYIVRTSDGNYEKSSWFNREYDLQREVNDTLKVYCTLEEELTRLEEKNRE